MSRSFSIEKAIGQVVILNPNEFALGRDDYVIGGNEIITQLNNIQKIVAMLVDANNNIPEETKRSIIKEKLNEQSHFATQLLSERERFEQVEGMGDRKQFFELHEAYSTIYYTSLEVIFRAFQNHTEESIKSITKTLSNHTKFRVEFPRMIGENELLGKIEEFKEKYPTTKNTSSSIQTIFEELQKSFDLHKLPRLILGESDVLLYFMINLYCIESPINLSLLKTLKAFGVEATPTFALNSIKEQILSGLCLELRNNASATRIIAVSIKK